MFFNHQVYNFYGLKSVTVSSRIHTYIYYMSIYHVGNHDRENENTLIKN